MIKITLQQLLKAYGSLPADPYEHIRRSGSEVYYCVIEDGKLPSFNEWLHSSTGQYTTIKTLGFRACPTINGWQWQLLNPVIIMP